MVLLSKQHTIRTMAVQVQDDAPDTLVVTDCLPKGGPILTSTERKLNEASDHQYCLNQLGLMT